jgi:hypothetical protein
MSCVLKNTGIMCISQRGRGRTLKVWQQGLTMVEKYKMILIKYKKTSLN